MLEKVYKTKIANVDELCDRIVNAWEELGQRVIDAAVRQWRARLRTCVSARGGHFEHYSVIEINLVIYFEWLVPCLLLNCKRQSFFFAKVTLSNSCFVAVFRVVHFTRYETTIWRYGGLYCYCLIYKVFPHICWKFDKNTCTVTQIMTNNVRFLFFRSQCREALGA